jgi:murein DD-endopeptidase MepM/ murein hydrolase activator NlpD
MLILGALPVAAQDGTTVHVVQRGETLYRIAVKYGTTVDAIALLNGIQDAHQIQAGQRLLIPVPSAEAEPPSEASLPPEAAETVPEWRAEQPGIPTTHTVGPGDTLNSIALRYGTTADAIAKRNGILNPESIYVGQVLNLREGSAAPPIGHGQTHTVQSGETLYRIAAKYGLSWQELARANALTNTAVIYPGQQLVIPGGEGALVQLPEPFVAFDAGPLPAAQGGTLRVTLETVQAAIVSGHFMGRPLNMITEGGTRHAALIGIAIDAPAGRYPLVITASISEGDSVTVTRDVQVSERAFYSMQIQIPATKAHLLDPALVKAEDERFDALMAGLTLQRRFDGPFGLPVTGAITSGFGQSRSYNGGVLVRAHGGVDFASAGASIKAPAAGYVVFTGDVDVRGLATVIDHGWGVYSGYWHQSAAHVEAGQYVESGQVIGTVGTSGLSSGPHLHWELHVGGVAIDPLQWTRETF